jgi:hypothetical protein
LTFKNLNCCHRDRLSELHPARPFKAFPVSTRGPADLDALAFGDPWDALGEFVFAVRPEVSRRSWNDPG